MKQLASRAFTSVLGWSTDVSVLPGAADFRLMSRETVRILRQMREIVVWVLRGMVPWAGFSSAVVVYDQEERHAGTPGYTWRRSLRLAQHGVFSFSVLPLHVITWLGVFFAMIAAIYLGYVAWVAFNGSVVTGWPSVIGVLLIVSAFQFAALSILAQYVGMIFEQAKQRPLYVLRQARLGRQADRPSSLVADGANGLFQFLIAVSEADNRVWPGRRRSHRGRPSALAATSIYLYASPSSGTRCGTAWRPRVTASCSEWSCRSSSVLVRTSDTCPATRRSDRSRSRPRVHPDRLRPRCFEIDHGPRTPAPQPLSCQPHRQAAAAAIFEVHFCRRRRTDAIIGLPAAVTLPENCTKNTESFAQLLLAALPRIHKR